MDVRVLYVATDVNVPGKKGASTHTLELSSALASMGNAVHVLSRRSDRSQSAEESIDGADFRRIFRGLMFPIEGGGGGSKGRSGSSGILKWFYDLFLTFIHSPYCAFHSVRLIREHDIDVILERGSSLGAGALASLITGRPLVLEVIDQRHSRISIRVARTIIAYRPDVLKIEQAPDRLLIVTAAANTESFAYTQSRQVDLVGYVGSFRRWHGVEDLIRAASILKSRGQRAQFLMVGPGNDDMMRMAEELDVSEMMDFTGGLPYETVPERLSRCGILAAPFDPSRDPFMMTHGYIFSPLKVFEYMSLGRAVVATAIDQITDVVESGRNGLLVPTGNPEAIAEALNHLIGTPAEGIRIGKRARRSAESLFSWRALAERICGALLDRASEGDKEN
jgi:glycosyltransferase involved in cell wall biosynthesis